MSHKGKPISKKEEIRKHPDKKIDEDFQGYPVGPAKDETIRPTSEHEEQVADMKKSEKEKRRDKKDEIDEQDSDGSANAFEGK